MSVRIGCGMSTDPDARLGALEAATAAAATLGPERADLVCVFASGAHLAAPEATLEGVHDALDPAQLVGCGAGGVLGGEREVEQGTAVAVWAAALDGGTATTFHAETTESEGSVAVTGLPNFAGAAAAILLPDPYSFPTDGLLAQLRDHAPRVPFLGGLSSARSLDGDSALFHGDQVHTSGAVGVRLDGVEVLPCVSQGAVPLGPELTITAAEGHVIHELAGRPALVRLRELFEELPPADRERLSHGLLLGIVVEHGKPDYVQGDFLVRGLLGADPDSGSIAMGMQVSPGQVVRLHARDHDGADRDLRASLGLRRRALGGERPAGALMFLCGDRGRGLLGERNRDAVTIADELAGAPAVGFYAAGEIGPVGGDSFVHGFTATLALFPA
jgi:small ligand-binding sensory domain FIST